MKFRGMSAIDDGVAMPIAKARRIARETVDSYVNQVTHLDRQAKEFWQTHADYWRDRNGGGEPGRHELECRSMAASF